MNLLKKIQYVFLALIATFSVAEAQDIKTDLELAQKLMENPSGFYTKMKVNIEYTADFAADVNTLKQLNTVIKIGNGNYFLQNEMTTILINEKWVVGIIHPLRQIVYGINTPAQFEKTKKKMMAQNIPTAPGINGKSVFLGETEGIKKYKVESSETDIKYTEVQLNARTHFFHRIENVYREPYNLGVTKTTTTFVEFNGNAQFSPEEFSESQFLVFTGQSAKPTSKYKNYQVVFSDLELLNSF